MQLHVSALCVGHHQVVSRQPDDGLHTGPKHVVAYNMLLLIIYNCCVL